MFDKRNDRRDFLKKASLVGMASVAAPGVFAGVANNSENTNASKKKISIKENDIIVFQGDSITDAGRKKDSLISNNAAAFGNGYAFVAAAKLLKEEGDKKLNIYNRGISGNKVYQLADRWEVDCLSLKPNILSILIGVNDFWHMVDGKYTGTLDKYRDDFKALLTKTKEKLPDVQFIIGEPFAVIGIKAVTEKWYPAFNDYRAAAKEVAEAFDAAFIPYQDVFDKAQKTAPGVYWTGDGVHPSMAGAQLMADAWLQTVKY